MIKKCNSSDSNLICEYIGNYYDKCLYLYLDYKRYGFSNENVKFYFQYDFNKKICALILIYFKSMHIFTKENNIKYDELIKFIIKENPKIICAEKSIVAYLEKYLNYYESQYGYVRKMSDFDITADENFINEASKTDLIKIAKLIANDFGLSGGLSYEEIYNQLLERYESGYCRNFILKNNKRIIGHICSGAESDNICILTDLIIDNDYRRKGLGKMICEAFCKKMFKENKKVYLISYTPQSNKLYEKIGFNICCEWGKLYKK